MDEFQAEILKLPGNLRCYKTNTWRLFNWAIGWSPDWSPNDCVFGIPSNAFFAIRTLQRIPNQVKGFYFYLGANQYKLIEKFTKSHYSDCVEFLAVGDSSYGNGAGRDYSQIVKTLGKGSFPRLKILQLGVWELFSNSHCLYGTLGDISDLFDAMPNLEELWLYGSFELLKPPVLNKLKKLYVCLDDPVTGINGGDISNETLCKLLLGSYPLLEELCADLEIDDPKHEYILPDAFLTGESVPNLKKIELTGNFKMGERTRLIKSVLGKRENTIFFIEELL